MTTPARRRRTRTTVDHANLANLDFASAGHTGFAGSTHTHTSPILSTFLRPVGVHDMDDAMAAILGITPKTAEVSEEARALYLGPAPADFTAARIGVDVFTAAVGTDWCEVGLLKGTPVIMAGPSSLTLVGYADASSDWGTPGPVATNLSGLVIAAGEHLWLAWSCKVGGGTLPDFRATMPDAILSGLFVNASGVRLSTMVSGTAFNRVGAALLGVRSVVGFS